MRFPSTFILSLTLLAGCASNHLFPKSQPLFTGLDETKVPSKCRVAVANAKEDFLRAQRREKPLHAREVTGVVCAQQKLYRGDGYLLTVRDNDLVRPQEHGVRVVLESRLTGGHSFCYDDIDRSAD